MRSARTFESARWRILDGIKHSSHWKRWLSRSRRCERDLRSVGSSNQLTPIGDSAENTLLWIFGGDRAFRRRQFQPGHVAFGSESKRSRSSSTNVDVPILDRGVVIQSDRRWRAAISLCTLVRIVSRPTAMLTCKQFRNHSLSPGS